MASERWLIVDQVQLVTEGDGAAFLKGPERFTEILPIATAVKTYGREWVARQLRIQAAALDGKLS